LQAQSWFASETVHSGGFEDVSFASWSPDGMTLAVIADHAAQGWEHRVFVFDLEEGGLDQVTSGRCHDTRPNWVPLTP